MADIFQRALALGATTSLDTNWDPDESWNDGLQDLLRLTDVFLPNEQEARLISGSASLDEALVEFKKMGIHVTALKLGKEGAILASGKQRFTQKLPPVTGGDSIGAGDSFDAGFLAGWLRGFPLDDCLRIASHCGREVASQVGGLRGQPDWETINRLANID
jgi:sugar/nucleoside kinase (ribokinase family)